MINGLKRNTDQSPLVEGDHDREIVNLPIVESQVGITAVLEAGADQIQMKGRRLVKVLDLAREKGSILRLNVNRNLLIRVRLVGKRREGNRGRERNLGAGLVTVEGKEG